MPARGRGRTSPARCTSRHRTGRSSLDRTRVSASGRGCSKVRRGDLPAATITRQRISPPCPDPDRAPHHRGFADRGSACRAGGCRRREPSGRVPDSRLQASAAAHCAARRSRLHAQLRTSVRGRSTGARPRRSRALETSHPMEGAAWARRRGKSPREITRTLEPQRANHGSRPGADRAREWREFANGLNPLGIWPWRPVARSSR
jgi:hypothetical protein